MPDRRAIHSVTLSPSRFVTRKASVCLVSVAFLNVFSPLVFAVESESDYADDLVIEEIVVSAKRRLQMVQDVAMSITAFSGSQIEDMRIVNVNKLSQYAPGLTISNYNKATPQLFMRGIGSNTSGAADDSSVAIFIDDVYIARPGFFDNDIFNIETVEVLRGPQGTLYGKNVVGGVIKVNHKQPTFEPELKLGVSIGNLDRKDISVFANSPLTDTVSANFSVSSRNRDGYVTNSVTGENERDEKTLAVRGQVLFDVSDRLVVRTVLDANDVDNNGNGRGLAGQFPSYLENEPSSINQYAESDSPVEGFTDSKDYGIAFYVDYESEAYEWVSISAYRNGEYQFEDEFVPLRNHRALVNTADESSYQMTQEFRVSNIDDEDYSYVAGVYFLTSSVDRLEVWDGRGLTDLVSDVLLGGSVDSTSAINRFDASNDTTGYAIFSEIDYEFVEDWTVSAGGRYSVETKSFQSDATGGDPLGIIGILVEAYSDVDEKETWQDFSPKVSLKYAIDTDSITYLSYTEGFKSGTFNSLASRPEDARTAIEPERAKQWEIGYKSWWFDKRLLFNTVGFYVDYDDLQVFQIEGGATIVKNAATARTKGAELELIAIPLSRLEVGFNYSYLEAQYVDYSVGGEDFSGNFLFRSPRNSYSSSISYKWVLGAFADLRLRVDYSYQDEMFFKASNVSTGRAEPQKLLNFGLQLASRDLKWEATLWGNNITGEETVVFSVPIIDETISNVPGEPKTYGITINYYLTP